MFTYENGETWESVNIHEDYTPVFLDDLIDKYTDDPFLDQANATCEADQECLFDTLATHDEEVGKASKASSEQFQSEENQLGKELMLCLNLFALNSLDFASFQTI